MNPPRKKKNSAGISREDPGEVSQEKGVDWEGSQEVRVRGDEQHGSSSREQDHPVGQTDAGEARQGQQSGQTEKVAQTDDEVFSWNFPIIYRPEFGEQWRGTVGRVTYRVTITVPTNLLPSRLLLERLISHAGETEAWEAEWGIK